MAAFQPYTVTVHDRMQDGYTYIRSVPEGSRFHPGFQPELEPKSMLALGVFGGKYLTDCRDEYPEDWFSFARLNPRQPDPTCNCFGVLAGMPLSAWRDRGWIHPDDPRGWFQWYCRYYMGRRMPEEDQRQIGRWRRMTRHVSQVRRHCRSGDIGCRRVQLQALLQWAYDSRRI